ncbi:hypothetical protein ABZ883_28035 [Streptomyces sp. NPDC046977]|uniref:hypothetical protein n=1 Tax=Streptomyces sp. NPDC046977 TaxID=3154703 RepID=UPI0033D9304A
MTNALAGLFKSRHKDAARSELLGRSVRSCAQYLAEHGEPQSRQQARLAAAVGTLVTAHSAQVTDGAPTDEAFDALLRTGSRALEVGTPHALRLALDLGESATTLRRRSKGAWLLLGRALDGLGRGDEAITAYESHLGLQTNPGAAPDVTRRVRTLREQRACLDEAAGLLPGEDAAALRESRPVPEAQSDLAAYTRSRIASHGADDPSVRRLAELYATHRRLTERGRVSDPLLAGAQPLDVTGLRRLVAGRTVCVVAGAKEVAASGLGAGIDGYDLVVRCDGLRLRAEGTGSRTDLHAVTLRGDAPWDAPAWQDRTGIRLVYGDSPGDWRRASRQRLVPGAQEHFGDVSLRRPLGDPALLGESGWGGETTTAFTTIRLLDFLDVSPRLDLIGLGLPGQLRPKEKEWVTAHATNVDDSKMRIALR